MYMIPTDLDEMISEYIDEELIPSERERFERLIQADSVLAKKIYDLQEIDYTLLESFLFISPSSQTLKQLEFIKKS